MALDLKTDAKRIHLALIFSFVLSLAVLGLVFYRSLYPSWMQWQQTYRTLVDKTKPTSSGIVQINLCNGDVDRCTTCHLGMHIPERLTIDFPKVFRSHPDQPHMRSHLQRGCTPCHGGTGRALESRPAHALEGHAIQDPLMRAPYMQAGCTHCHLIGQQPGQQRLVSGAFMYLRLGCVICHPLIDGGLGGYDYGPNLRKVPRRSLAYLENSLIDPTANYAKSTMPSFAASFSDQKQHLTDLIVYLISLSLKPYPQACKRLNQPAIGFDTACTSCHAGLGGRATGRFRHRCLYLIQRAKELDCGRCHTGPLPSGRHMRVTCPLVERHQPNCQVCHLHDRPRGE